VTEHSLRRDNDALRRRLEEAEDTIRALHAGEVDAIVVAADRHEIFTLEAADKTYRLLVEQMPQAAATLNLDGEILSCNRPFAELLDRPVEQLVRTPFRDYVAAEHRATIMPLLQQSLADEVQTELTLESPEGRRSAVYLRVAALKEGAFGQCLMITDQTEQHHYRELRQAQHALRAVSERLELAQEAGHLGIFEWHPSGEDAVSWSPIHEDLFGIPTGGFRGRLEDWIRAMHPGDATRVEEALRGAASRRAPVALEYRIVHPDGSIRWIQSRAKIDGDRAGDPVRMVGVSRDVTERRHAVAELERSNADKDEFLATLAHELRNPLAPIRSAAEIIRLSSADDLDLRWAREVIERQVHIMARLLEDLLDVSRLSRHRLELRREQLELSAVVEAALETTRPLIEARQHALTIELPAQPVPLEADPVRLAQVFANLLNNAAKFTPEGGDLRLTAELRDNEVLVAVRDNGIGISPELLPRIFEIFSQAAPPAHSGSGLGIGLSLVKGLVELHGGRVVVRAGEGGRGTEFVVHLPLAEPMMAPTTLPGEHGQATAQQRCRVLVVDDNRDSADSLARLLELSGQEVRVAYGGEQALQVAAELRPEIVLLDLGMPGMDGYETCRRIRGAPWGHEVTLIALTGWGQEADRRRTTGAGFDAHLVKPVSPEELLTLMKGGLIS
jgi:PAS domain S-box-containing protein